MDRAKRTSLLLKALCMENSFAFSTNLGFFQVKKEQFFWMFADFAWFALFLTFLKKTQHKIKYFYIQKPRNH